MRAKTKIALILSFLVLGFVMWFVVLPAIRFSAARKRYSVGMPYEDAVKKISQPFQVYTSGVVFPQAPTEEQKQIFSLYEVVIPTDGVYLEFNYQEKLTAIRPLNSPWDSFKEKQQRKIRQKN